MRRNLMLFFQNATVRLRTIRLEPWARHFLLGPDEKLEIIARPTGGNASFRMVEAIDTTLIYTEVVTASVSFRTIPFTTCCQSTKAR
jgi:hypothetical protein